MLEKIVKKFKPPLNVAFGIDTIETHHNVLYGRYKFILFSKQPHIFPNAGLIQIFKNRSHPWAGYYLEYGVRSTNIIQIIPFYFLRNNSTVSFGIGFYKAYFGLKYKAVTSPKLLRNKVFYYFGNLW